MDLLLGVLQGFLPSRLCHWLKKKHLFHVFTRLKIRHHIPITDLQVIHLFVTCYSGQVEIYLGFFKFVVTVFGCFFREQYDREQALDDFKTGKAKILIATDVASRGLDIRGVTWVISLSSKVLWVISPKNSYQFSLLHSRFYVVTQRSSPQGALRDDSKNGCVADYYQLEWDCLVCSTGLLSKSYNTVRKFMT